MPHQPPLFPLDVPPPTPPEPQLLEARFQRLRDVASSLPSLVRLGTSSWSFPGWCGLVYADRQTEGRLARDGLRDYARHPLFRTVGIDRTYYAPVPDEDWRRYADQLPPGFPCCCKAPSAVTSPVVPTRGTRDANADFLSPDRFMTDLIDPVARLFRDHAGPFVLQFPSMLRPSGLGPAAFVEGLDRFLGGLPRDFHYGVELRDRALLTDGYARVLERHGAAHVFNAWTAMPWPSEQAAHLPVESMPFLLVRLLLQPGVTYEQKRVAFAPFDTLAAPHQRMRDDVVDLVGRAVARSIPAFVLVNNGAEGCAPLTIEALAERLARP